MQRPDENKRRLIVDVAARLFANRPYHKVRLDDIAAGAKIGKGTLYVYFENKEELYRSLLFDGLVQMVQGLRDQLEEPAQPKRRPSGPDLLRRAVDVLVSFAFAHPNLYEMMRNVGEIRQSNGSKWTKIRSEIIALIARCIRRGIKDGDLADPHPDITAACVGGMVRSIVLFGPKASEREVADHIYRILTCGILADGTKR